MGESTLLSSHPDIIRASAGNGVDDIVGDPIGGDNHQSFLALAIATHPEWAQSKCGRRSQRAMAPYSAISNWEENT